MNAENGTMSEVSPWEYVHWITGDPRLLKAKDLFEIKKGEPRPPSALGYWRHADISYLACRLLFLAGEALHHAALYMAAQTVEKYLKAILLALGKSVGDASLRTHNLRRLAQEAGPPFNERPFADFCGILSPFEIAGRYDDGHDYAGWRYSINVLAVLDRFVAVSRKTLAGLGTTRPVESDPLQQILRQDGSMNPFMMAGTMSLVHRNRLLQDILRHV